MFFSRILYKSKYVLVEIESTVTGFKREFPRERKAEKLELIQFDPLIGQQVVFKETKKIEGIDKGHREPWRHEERRWTQPWQVRTIKGKLTSSD